MGNLELDYKNKQLSKFSFTLYITLILFVFFIDILTPRGFAVWLLYIFPIWVIVNKTNKHYSYSIVTLSTLLIILGYFFSPVSNELEYLPVLNRAFGIIAFWILAYLLINSKQKEREHQDREYLFKRTFENAAVGITHILPDGRWLWFNSKFKEIVGYSSDELSKLTFQKITHHDDLPGELELRQKLINGEINDFSMEKRYLKKNGEIVWVNLSCSVMKNNPEKSSYLIAVIQDISDRKEIEDKLINQTKMAEELSDFNLEILESSPFGIATYEETGNCTYANDAFCDIIGATRTQTLAQNFHSIKSWKESGVYELALEAVNSGKPQIRELRVITAFGKLIWAEWRIVPFLTGDKLNLLVILNDITPYRQAERNIEIQKIRIEKLAALSKSLSEQTLDLNSILATSVKTISEISGDCVSIRLISDDGKMILTPATFCEDKNLLNIYQSMVNKIPQMSDEGITSGVIRTGLPIYINDFSDHSNESVFKKEYKPYNEKLKTASIMILPLIHHKNVLGVLSFSRSDKERPYTDDEQSFLMEAAERIAATLANVKLYHEKLAEIEERKKVEEELRNSEESYSALFNTKSNAIVHFDVITDIKGQPINLLFVEVNNAYVEILNLTKAEVEGKLITEVFPGIDKAPQNYIMKYGTIGLKGGELVYDDYFEPTKIWVSNYVFSPKSGKVIVIFNDITARKITEESLKESEERQRLVLEAANLGVWDLDLVNDIAIRSLRHDQIWGYTELQKEWGFEVAMRNVVDEDKTLIMEAYEKGIKSGLLFHENRVTWPDGSIHWIRAYGRFRYNDEGKPIRVIGIVEDITDRKRVEEALYQSEEKFSKAFNVNPSGLVISRIDDGKIFEVNEAFLKLFGFTREEVIGNTSIALNMFADSVDRGKVIDRLHQDGTLRDYEVNIRTKEGKVLVVLLSSEMFNVNGEHSIITTFQDITERKLMEEALRESEQQYSALFNTKSNAIGHFTIITDDLEKPVNIQYLKINNAYEKIMNLKREDVEGRMLTEVFPGIENSPMDYIGRYGKIGIEGGELLLEDYFTPNDLWISVYVFSPKKNKIIVIFTDITERKRTEEALKESENRFRQLADSMPQVVWTANPDGKVDYYNERVENFDGFKQNEDGCWEWAPVLHEEDLDTTNQAWTNAVKLGTIYEVSHRLRLKDGNFRWHLSRGIPIKNPEGKIIKWYGTATDIHQQKLIQAKLEKTLEDLKLSEEKLLEAQKLAHVGSFTVNYFANNYVEWSQEMFNIYGRPVEKGNPTIEEAFRAIHPDDIDKVRSIIDEAKNDNKKIEVEYRILLPDNSVKYLHTIINPVFDSSGNLRMIFGTSIDNTERKLQQKKLEELLDELIRSNKELEQFAYTASHDLQEPIRMVKSYTELLNKRYRSKLDEDALEYLGFINDSSSRMQQLVSDLLKYSRISTKAKTFEVFDSNEVLSEVLQDLKFIIQETGTTVEYEELPIINGDRTQIRQVFQNLIQNAVKFRNNIEPKIKIKCIKKNDVWIFIVEDNGIGIEQQYLDRIFIIFQRLHSRQEYPGTGIGLALVKKIIERHGGQVWVESEPGKGSTFYFTLPKQNIE